MNTTGNASLQRPQVAVIIPAYNEEETVGEVAKVASVAALVDEVVVVDNASSDDTAGAAREAGARVVRCEEKGKGQAMRAGVAATEAEFICFLDADLLNLGPAHVDRLIKPIIDGDAGMTLGLFDRGPELNPLFLNALPRLTGQRAMHRSLFEGLDIEHIKGYKVEAALNSRADELGLEIDAFVCDGLWHRTKEEKHRHGRVAGSLRKVGMLATAVWSYVSYAVRRPFQSGSGTTVKEREDEITEG
ncbi:MAG: glycosyltransferase [Nitriliruptorales bacterium]|nr:glycosyltransferase [Nitriliruptorales bacterium]